MKPPSIFNDVLGPVMRGPSSSHSAAALRIGRLARDLMAGRLEEVVVEYDPNGSLVTTHACQGSDLGLFGGLLGFDTDDGRLLDYRGEMERSGTRVDIRYVAYGAEHPNTYKLTLVGGGERRTMTAISTGGGMIEVREIDGARVEMAGDYYETLVFARGGDLDIRGLAGTLGERIDAEACEVCQGGRGAFLDFKSRAAPPAEVVAELASAAGVGAVRVLGAVLPVLARRDLSVPFENAESMVAVRAREGLGTLGDMAARYESERGGVSVREVRARMGVLVEVMEGCVRGGLAGTEYADRILPCQSVGFGEKMASGALLPGDLLNTAIQYVSAIMEMKSSLGVIVAAPTAGSCGALPGTLLAAADVLGKGREERVEAMLAAGLIGVFIARGSTFAAEVAGCMAECGSGASMAAAGLVTMAGGSFEQAMGAASMALQSSFGMTCDTLANRVEAPCLNRNVTAAANAIASANMAMADYRHLVPFDEVVEAMRQVGDLMPRELCCTGLGGLAVTPTSRAIEKELAGA